MIQIKVFVFNPFQENTYILHDDTKECIIIDPGCYTKQEETELSTYISDNQLNPVAIINTHTHIDHILGNNFIFRTFNLKPIIHDAGTIFLSNASDYAAMFGIQVADMVMPEKFIDEGDKISFGKSTLEVLYTPGHADGSVCLVNHEQSFVITGDVLFNGSIGRTDLLTGDFDILTESITQKLYSLPDNYIVYPGHGETTTIGNEKLSNPFIRG